MSSPWWYIFYNLVLWLLAFIISYNKMQKYPYKKSYVFSERAGAVLPVFLIMFIFTWATFTGGDDENYRLFVESGYKDWEYLGYMPIEKAYSWIASFVNGNFFLWRIVVYGTALFLTYKTMSRLHCLNYVTILAFVLLILTSYGTTRSVLAFAVFVFGASFFDEKNFLLKVIGIAIMVSSVFLHSSMIIPAIFIPVIVTKFTKKRIIAFLVFAPVAVLLLRFAFQYIFDDIFIMESVFGQKLDTYTSEDGSTGTDRSFLVNTLIIVRYLVTSILVFYSLKAEILLSLPKSISCVIRISALIYLASMLLLFVPIQSADFLSTRYITMIPAFLYLVWPFYLNESSVIKRGNVKLFLLAVFLNPFIYWFMKVFYQSVA